MATAKNLTELAKMIQTRMSSAMANEVASKVKDVEQSKIKSEVYDAYKSQTPYAERRYSNGGLIDRDNMKSWVEQNENQIQLNVKNMTGGNPNVDYTTFTDAPNYLAGIIEYGRLPNKDGLYTSNASGTENEYLQPRKFTEETVKSLLQSKAHIKAMKDGLKRQGVDSL